MRSQHNFRLPVGLMGRAQALADRKGLTLTYVLEQALDAHLTQEETEMTREALNITHILEDSPRGFANEVHVLPLNREYLLRGEEIVSDRNDDIDGWAYLYAWDEAPAHLRSACGALLRDLDSQERYDSFMTECLLPLFAADPNAYDLIDGQWTLVHD